MTGSSAVLDAVGALLPPLLGTFERVGWVQRYLHPPIAGRLADEIAPHPSAIAGPLAALEAAACPAEIMFMRDRLVEVARRSRELVEAFVQAARSSGDFVGLYRPLRRFARVQEALYPLAPALEPVSRWFLEPARRDDASLIARLRAAALRDDGARTGVLHAGNERDARGGFSLYVPETWDGRASMPLVVALHGGHGHGRDFLWSWLREARSRGVLVIAPTSRDHTWSIMGGEDADAEGLREMIETVAARYPVDRGHVLLTGMSDGATYAFLCGLRAGTPFTHLAPACGVLHPFLFADGSLARARGRPIYLVHGALDWMFPVEIARQAREALTVAGARLVYRELEDLSHAYPREENPRILDWLMAA
ncbi:MAG TPA: phospholipase [Methylomirabilota bacterium]|nr:phospholipase [Methylomirabilota bacterium]